MEAAPGRGDPQLLSLQAGRAKQLFLAGLTGFFHFPRKTDLAQAAKPIILVKEISLCVR